MPKGISLERVAAAAGLIVEMAAGWLKPRKRKERPRVREGLPMF